MAEQRKRRRSHYNTSSQKVISRRMREMWCEGFGLLPHAATDVQIDRTRKGLRDLAADDKFWLGLKQLIALKRQVSQTVERLKDHKAKTSRLT